MTACRAADNTVKSPSTLTLSQTLICSLGEPGMHQRKRRRVAILFQKQPEFGIDPLGRRYR